MFHCTISIRGMNWKKKISRLFIAITVLTIIAMLPNHALASTGQLICGQTITESVTMTSDLIDCPYNGIIIGADNITIDGNGHTIDGIGNGSGIALSGRKGVSVKNLEVTQFSIGVSLYNAFDNDISHNTLVGNNRGVRLASSNNNIINMNIILDSFLAIRILSNSNDNIITNNIVSGTTSNSINLQYSNDNIVDNNTVSNNAFGIDLYQSNDNTITNNTVTNNYYGIRIILSKENTVKKNEAENNWRDGFYVDAMSSENTIQGNNSTNNKWYGFRDYSIGEGTSDTANKYMGNTCVDNILGESNPLGLCK